MKTKFFKSAILITSVLFATAVFGQQPQNSKLTVNDLYENHFKVKMFNGSVYANFADQNVTTKEIVSRLNRLLKLDDDHTFEQISQRNDEVGFSHINFQELYKGYPVDGHIIMLHEKEGLLQSINGNAAKLKNIYIEINISDEQATDIAMKVLGVKKLFREHTVQTVFAKNPKDNMFYLTKKVRIESLMPLVRYDVFIDAQTGEIMKKISLIHNTDVQGTAQTFFKGTQTITCDKISANSYQLYDNARNIGTYNGATWLEWGDEPELYKNTSVNWSNNPALDVHWGIEKTYDYFLTTFQRKSYDGYGGEIANLYDPVLFYNEDESWQYNAASIGDGWFVYGKGDPDYGYNPFVSLDCAGHEFTHMVTEENGNGGLNYEGEAGALNESFSDIFGTCIEFYVNINPNWTIGEDIIIGGAMRSMSNPNMSGGYNAQPDTYLGDYWVNTNSGSDHGGVHTNSGVQNFWFYLLCKGGSGINDLGNSYSVTPIGMANAQKIAYRNLINYLTPNAGYLDAYNGSLQAATDLFGGTSVEYTAVKQAWYAVGIDDNTILTSCQYPKYFTEATGTFDDGSGNENYKDNQSCTWVIAPPCSSSITLSFSAFNTESGYDFVYIYDMNLNKLAQYSGNNIPNAVTTNTGMLYVIFETDQYVNGQGFTAKYTSVKNPQCPCETVLTAPSGTISDGSGANEYSNKMQCVWHITPPNAKSITLTFTEFQTEYGYDIVEVRDDVNNTSQQFSGNSIPAPVTIPSGKMSVIFITDVYETAQGWTANYSSSTTGLENIKDDNIIIFPNPAKNIVNIQFAENQQNVIIEIYDVVGKSVMRNLEKNISANSTQSLNIENIPSGVYNIVITSDTKIINHKLLISK